MSNTVIEFNNVGKQYILGTIGTGTLSQDLNRWWATIRGKEDPYLKIGETNDRTQKGESRFVWALRDINFKVEQGDVVGIIGKNGAGKSTLLKILSRVTSPTTGDIKIKGRIASLLEVGTGFHPEMTGRENIFMNGSIMGMTKAEIKSKFDEIVDFAGVAKYVDTPVKRYSSGMMVRLGFAIAAHLEPEILVVDEVLAVGDAEFQKKAIGKMKDVSQQGGRTVLFVSHNMDSMLNLCNKGTILENGKVVFESDIRSAVAEYLSSGKSDVHYIRHHTNNERVFVKEVCFEGNENQQKGSFSFAENISFRVVFGKQAGSMFEKKTVASLYIQTMNQTKICCQELKLEQLERLDEVAFTLTYPAEELLPNTYMIHIDIHLPNVCFYDRQDTCTFNIYDNGTDFLKYNGRNMGFVMLKPQIIINE
jgi:ABC-type polysaccharide/polyol phosphate transport system ATPase subunit